VINYHTRQMINFLQNKDVRHNCNLSVEIKRFVISSFGYSYLIDNEYIETDKVDWQIVNDETRTK